MKKGEYLKKFFLNEYNYYKESFNTEKNILLIDRQRYNSSILISLIALALNKKYKMK